MDRRGFLLASCATLALAGRGHADDLDDQVARLASEGHVCAVSATMLRNGHEARALSASGCGANPGSDAVFQAASLSKPVVAYVVLRLARRGELSLDHPLSEIFPDGYQHRQNLFALKAAPIVDTVAVDVLRTVTPRLLLSHGAGFPNWASDGPLTQTSAPGTCWQYSGEGYVLLQRMLETLTGRPLQQLAEQELFAPIGLTNTAFKLTPAIQTQLVAGSPRQLRFPYEIAASSLYTTANDYARFMAAVLNDEQLLSSITRDPRKLSAPHLSWGLGWGLEEKNHPVAIWHWGSNPGFRALAMANLQSRDAIVVLTSSDAGMPLAKTILGSVMPGDHPALALDLVR
ncbi:beta-lactamase family protein [Bradyrhizobium sp. CCGUVB4N]|uniref:serine hydrolase domain-containing protein n=1 Tax=Bradyrhizobium sp. CCGUVB4N TaxID=2949631 RepID=UPI0020B194C3|nr:serine hydrolase domain-containing protein [Bradyrhizobium sp. CCGUVB4N]MCP3382240.1 beta-lactamase family protein [Bradyrhizobium sp. CCGUVB4N]